MSTRLFRILAALSCIFGVIMLITSFAINPGPGPNPTLAQLIAFSNQYRNQTLIGAWLQSISPALIVLFAFAIVHLADATTRMAGWMTLFGGIMLMLVSLLEVTFYLSAVDGNPATTGLISIDLISATQHLYSMVTAPLLFFSLATVILTSRVLPHAFGYAAIVFGIAFAGLGLPALFSPLQNVANVLAFVQGLWWLLAAITLLVQTLRTSETATANALTNQAEAAS
jgi:hypothetical protein